VVVKRVGVLKLSECKVQNVMIYREANPIDETALCRFVEISYTIGE
jgi:hypothetical protein